MPGRWFALVYVRLLVVLPSVKCAVRAFCVRVHAWLWRLRLSYAAFASIHSKCTYIAEHLRSHTPLVRRSFGVCAAYLSVNVRL